MVLGLGLLGSFFVISGIVIYSHNSARTTPTSGSLNRAMIEGETGLALPQTPSSSVGFVLNDFHRSAVKDGKVAWEIFGKRAKYDVAQSRADVDEPRLTVNREKGETITLTAKRAELTLTGTALLKAELFDDVIVVHRGETTIKTDRAIYVKETEIVDMPNYVTVDNPLFSIYGKKLTANLEAQEIRITNGVKSTFKPRKR